jgi:hypothetical protein
MEEYMKRLPHIEIRSLAVSNTSVLLNGSSSLLTIPPPAGLTGTKGQAFCERMKYSFYPIAG